MKPPVPPLLFAGLVLVGMLALLEAGRRFGIDHRQKNSQGEQGNFGIIEGAIFALFGLVVAFTFSGAVSRFNEKRMLIAEEVNGIETAYLRLNLISQDVQPGLRQLFRQYVDSRAETYRRLPDMEAAEMEIAQSKRVQETIWAQAIAATLMPRSHPDAGKLLLPALNNMIDIATTRTMALRVHPPAIIYLLLLGLSLICSMLAGYRMSFGHRRSWLHVLSFALMTVITVYVILDIEYPRAGLIRLEGPDQVLLNIRDRMR
jgi:ABC-type glycerol-3-phosphate transport system permease component